MKIFKALLKREYWEHKGALFYTPAIVAGIFVTVIVIGLIYSGSMTINGYGVTFNQVAEHISEISADKRVKAVKMMIRGSVVPFGIILLVISLFYALGSLYDERKDRSILFWKSLPISDTSTVLSKFVAISIMAPLFYFAVITAFQVFLMIVLTFSAWFSGSSAGIFWSSINFFKIIFNTLFSLIVASLWLAPIWAWAMLASIWARKVAFLWGSLPILMVIIAEGWIFNTALFGKLVGERIVSAFFIQNSFIASREGIGLQYSEKAYVEYASIFEALFSTEFFVGIAVAAILLTATIYTRRFKNES